jgi:hypothetical protein
MGGLYLGEGGSNLRLADRFCTTFINLYEDEDEDNKNLECA